VQGFRLPKISDYLFLCARLVLWARRPVIVGITGSVGKTTTKEIVAAALMEPEISAIVGSVWKTPGNMNNTRGVPFVILGYRDWPVNRRRMAARLLAAPFRAFRLAFLANYPRILVLEFAAGPHGDIGRTAALAPPTVAIVTAVGPAHLEKFGTVERIASEKAELVRRAPVNGLVILGQDNALASKMDEYTDSRVLKLPGKGRRLAEAIARAVCVFLGVPASLAARAMLHAPTVQGRLQTLELGYITVINDAFNANPLSMELGLETLKGRGATGRRRVAILGEMKELGPDAARYHQEAACQAQACADMVVGVGELARHYRPDFWFATSAVCAAAMPELLRHHDYVLVKGSHSVGLNAVVRALEQLASARRGDGDTAQQTAAGGSQRASWKRLS
jgi:UDP-N-acetylmuramoyl-tripeptide--D-alanyl-D-alanine ligase